MSGGNGVSLLGEYLFSFIYMFDVSLAYFFCEILDTADGRVFVFCAGECQSCPEDERLPND